MNTQTEKPTRKLSRKKIILFYVIIYTVIGGVFYGGFVTYRTFRLYNFVKANKNGWDGYLHTADAALGFRPVPNSRGEQVLPIGPGIPACYDAHGFRVPCTDGPQEQHPQRPLILALGCSYTYGFATPAEETYPYLVGQWMGGTAYNAGVCSYGLVQMLLLARELIPKYQPDYVLVQYSPWLIERAQWALAPSVFGKTPSPFFYDTEEGLRIFPPIFKMMSTELPAWTYRHTPKSFFNAISFFASVGVPLFVYDDVNMAIYAMKRGLGVIPRPTEDNTAVEQAVYPEIAQIAKTHGATMAVVTLGKSPSPVNVPENLLPPEVIVVNAHEEMLERLPALDKKTFRQYYTHWRGSPPVNIDGHPNPAAHKIIAEKIVTKLKTP